MSVFFTLYSLVPVTRAHVPGLSSLYIGTMMSFVMGIQVFTPALVRRFSLRLTVAGSALLLGVGALLTGSADVQSMSLSGGLLLLLAGGAAAGAGFGILIVAGAHGVALLVPMRVLGRALGAYGLITMAATAAGSPAGVQLAVALSPGAFGLTALLLCIVAAGLALGIPGSVCGARADHRRRGPLGFLSGAPWLVLAFLLVAVMLLSHSLTSLPVLGSAHVSAAVVVFAAQAGNALGRGGGGELEARIGAAATSLTGAVLLAAGSAAGILGSGAAAAVASGLLLGLGVGVVQTVTLHTSMRRMDSGRASVVWNLAVDGGLWGGGIIWGLALASGHVQPGVLVIAAVAAIVGAAVVVQQRREDRAA